MEPGAVCSVAVWSLRPGDCLSSATWRTASAVDRFMDATAGDGGADGSYTHTGHDWLSSCHARDAQNRNLLHALTRGRADRFYFHGHSSPSPYSVGKLKHQKTGRMNRPLRLVGVDSSCPSTVYWVKTHYRLPVAMVICQTLLLSIPSSFLFFGVEKFIVLNTIYKDGTLCYTACEEVDHSWQLFRPQGRNGV